MGIEPDFDNMTDAEFEAFEKTTLMASDEAAEIIMEVSAFLRGDRNVDGLVLPAFGLLSMKARRTPIYAYGHPKLKEKHPQSFSDGRHIFVADDYLIKLRDAELPSNGERMAIVPMLLHHLLHMTLNHHRRFGGFRSDVAHAACDIFAHCKLRLAFPDMKWSETYEREFASFGLSRPEMEEIASCAEETIMRRIAHEFDKQKKKEDEEEQDGEGEPGDGESKDPGAKGEKVKGEKGKGEKSKEKGEPGDGEGEPGEGEPGEGEPGEGEPADGSEETLKKALKNAGMPNPKAGKPQNSSLDGQAGSEALEDAGCETTMERLDIPKPWDYESIEKKAEEVRTGDVNDIAKSVRMDGMAGTAGGGHLSGAAHEVIKRETEGRISWKLGLQETIGSSMNFKYMEDEPGDLYYVDPEDMGTNTAIYLGCDLPTKPKGCVMVLMDTSGSITKEIFKEFTGEIFGLLKSENPDSQTAGEVVMLCVDDVVRGEPVIMDENTVDEILENFEAQGRGGNDIGGTIRMAAKLPLFAERQISAIIYMTDLGDAPPVKEDVPQGVPLAFVCPSDNYHEEFARAVSGFARVFPIEDGLEADLSTPFSESSPRPAISEKARRQSGFGL